MTLQLLTENDETITKVAARFFNDPDEAADAAQEARIRAWQKLDKYDGSSKFSTWLYAVTRNVCLDIIRQRRETYQYDEDRDAVAVMHDPADEITEAWREAATDALASLPKKQKVVLTLCEVEGLTAEEAAERLGIPKGTVATRMAKARKNFDAALKNAARF